MKIALTVSSANYLPFAKSLGDSLIEYNPDYRFIIVLLDRFSGYDPHFFYPHSIVDIANMHIADFGEMNNSYSIFELSCALKPHIMEYFLNTEPEAEMIFYFDSDIRVFGTLAEAEKKLAQHSVLLTPHISKPLEEDGFVPDEEILLTAGLYNAGFIAISRTESTMRFLQWWKKRMKDRCTINTLWDQLWLNYVPQFFENTIVFYNPGYNVAYWNLKERTISKQGDKYVINDQMPLVFYHYSGFDINTPDVISRHQNRYTFETKPELAPLYKLYRDTVLSNNQYDFFSRRPAYGIIKKEKGGKKKKIFIKKIFQKIFTRK